jgi:pyruvate dehydrogenase E2 component (dihydrolipoamide acetyltransferase)
MRTSASQASAPRAAPKFSEVLEESHGEGIERIPLGTTRKAIARNMEAALSIPSAVNMELIDATALDGIVRREKRRAMDDRKVKLTMLPFVIKATIEALKENPNFNASYDHERLEIIRKNYYNIGIAAEAPDGLKVFVIRNADTKGILELAKEIQELGGKVRDQTITLDEMRDSSFTITNIGSLGGGFLAVPIINHPDVAILGVMLAKKMPVVVEDMVKIGMVLPVSLVFDHRVVDGAEAVRFTNSLKKYLEDPEFLEML